GGTPTTPGWCTNAQVGADHLLFILENGNADNNFGSNVETALDVEQAHGIATHAGMKYYDGDCLAGPSPGLTDGGCNGSDVGLEDPGGAAAHHPTPHTAPTHRRD